MLVGGVSHRVSLGQVSLRGTYFPQGFCGSFHPQLHCHLYFLSLVLALLVCTGLCPHVPEAS